MRVIERKPTSHLPHGFQALEIKNSAEVASVYDSKVPGGQTYIHSLTWTALSEPFLPTPFLIAKPKNFSEQLSAPPGSNQAELTTPTK
jgi:hypothetical protein